MPNESFLVPLPDANREALADPRVRGFLDKISKSEGADYDTLVGGRKIGDLSHHPNVVGLRTIAGPSTAFGRYQITGTTNKSKLAKYKDLDYSPENQDLRAVELLRQTKALEALQNDDESTAMRRAGREWASIPGSPLPGRKNAQAFQQQKTPPFLVPLEKPANDSFLVSLDDVATKKPTVTPSVTDALDKLTSDVQKRTEAIKPAPAVIGRGMARTSITGLSPFAGVEGAVGDAPEAAHGSANVEDALRQAAQSGVKETDRRTRIGSQMTREQAAANRTGLPGLPAYDMGNMSQVEREAAITSRAAVERDQEEEQRRQAEQFKKDKPEIDRLAKEYRTALRASKSIPQTAIVPHDWTSEMLAKGIAPLVEKFAGLGRASGAPGSEGMADVMRLHAEALRQAAEAEGADRNQASKFVQNVASGFIGSAPELALMSAGVPAPIVFGGGAGAEAYGARKSVIPAVAQGVGTGFAFEVPGVGKGLTEAATKGLGTGLTTTGIDLAAGATPGQAITSGVTNAFMRGVPSAKEAIGERNARRAETQHQGVQAIEPAQGNNLQPSVVAETAPELRPLAQEPGAASVPVEQPQRFQHLQFGEVEVLPDQAGANKGKIKVAEVDNSDNIHFVKKSDMQGRGNSRMIPIKESPSEPAVEPTASPETVKSEVEQSASTPIEPSAEVSDDLQQQARLNSYIDEAWKLSKSDAQAQALELSAEKRKLNGYIPDREKLIDQGNMDPDIAEIMKNSVKEMKARVTEIDERIQALQSRIKSTGSQAEINAPVEPLVAKQTIVKYEQDTGNKDEDGRAITAVAPQSIGQLVTLPEYVTGVGDRVGRVTRVDGDGKPLDVIDQSGKFYYLKDGKTFGADVFTDDPTRQVRQGVELLVREGEKPPSKAEDEARERESATILSRPLGKNQTMGWDVTPDFYLEGGAGIRQPIGKELIARILSVGPLDESSQIQKAIRRVVSEDFILFEGMASKLEDAHVADPWHYIYERVLPAKLNQGKASQPSPQVEAVRPEQKSANQSQELSTLPAESERQNVELAQSKEPWQKTQDEYIAETVSEPKSRRQAVRTLVERNKDWHRRQVEQALRDGKSVPKSVLADYPYLSAEVSKSELKGEPNIATALPLEPVAQEPKVPSTDAGRDAPQGERLPASSTAAKREKVTADREARGEEPIPKPERKPDEQLLADAKAANEKDPTEPIRLVDQVLNGKKGALNDTETVQVDLHVQELKNKYDAVNKEISITTDPAKLKDLTEKSDAMEREMRASEEAFAQSGTEKGRGLRAQRFEIDNDFRPLTMIAKRIKAKGDKPLTTEERETIKTQAQQIVDLEAKLEKANTRAEQAEAERAVSRIKRDVIKETRKQARGAKKQSLDDEAATLKNLIAQAWKKQKSPSQGIEPFMGLGKFDPEGEVTKLVLQLVRNRVKANLGIKGPALVDEIHGLLKDVMDVDKRQIRDMVSGYGRPRGTRSEIQKQIDALKSELYGLSSKEDIEAGTRSPRSEGPRLSEAPKQGPKITDAPKVGPRDTLPIYRKRLESQIEALQKRIDTGDFSKADKRGPTVYDSHTLAIQKRLETIKREYSKANYRATRSRLGMVTDELAKAANVPKTLKSMGDISAVFRQGGFYAITHPVQGLAKPTRDMLRSFSEAGYRNVENAIKNHPKFEQARRDGVEFTGVDKADPNLSHHEESYFGGETIDLLATGKYNPLRAVKGVKNFSERTFVSFLDSQRMYMYDTMTAGLTDPGIIRRTLGQKATNRAASPQDFKEIAKLINIGTGRGDIPRFLGGNKAAPVLNIGIFAPRLVASRVQLLNNMFNPVKMARMPAGVRNQMIADNVKFLAATAVVMKLAEAAGGTVNRDPDDADFLKIRFGSTTYDTLTGLQQPLRYIINMTRAATGGETYPGKDAGEMSKRFARSKVAPGLPSIGVDYLAGSDFQGRPFSLKRELVGSKENLYTDSQFSPLPAGDFIQAMQKEGLIKGAIKASPTVTGIGVQTYDEPSEKPTTKAEKLARKFIGENFTPKARTEDEIALSRQLSDLKARSRKGEDVKKELADLEGKIKDKQAKAILGAVNKTRFQEDYNRLTPKQAAIVYSVANEAERAQVKDILERKSMSIANMTDDEQADMDRRLKALGMTPETGMGHKPQKAKEAQEAKKAQSRSGYVFQ